jgi:hypothetical protein
MSKIRIIAHSPIYDGVLLTFKAPCDCTEVDGLRVYYDEVTEDTNENASQDFDFADAHGEVLTGLGNLFMEGAYVRVVLDTTNGYAYLQNADTNTYLENNFRTKRGTGEIIYNDEYAGDFYYAISGGVLQIRLETINFSPNSSAGNHYLRLVDNDGLLPSFPNGEHAEIQLNAYGQSDAEGAVSQVMPATLSTTSWYINVQDMAYVDTFRYAGTVTLLDVPTPKG